MHRMEINHTPKQDVGLARHLRDLEMTVDRAREAYSVACQQVRFGYTPEARAAAKARAEQLRTLAVGR